MRKPERKDLIQARKVSNMFQFINDLTAISDGVSLIRYILIFTLLIGNET